MFCLVQLDVLLEALLFASVESQLSDQFQGSHAAGKSWIFLGTISRSWKVLENGFGPGKSWKFECKVLESPGIF